jgi:glycerol kinase
MRDKILAIDQGTTNTKALLVDAEGRIVARGAQPTAISYPRPGWVEQDAREIWRCTRGYQMIGKQRGRVCWRSYGIQAFDAAGLRRGNRRGRRD